MKALVPLLLLFHFCAAGTSSSSSSTIPSLSRSPSADSSPLLSNTTTTLPTTTTISDPTLCSFNASSACVVSFDRFYQRRGVNGTYTPTPDENLRAGLRCDAPQAAGGCMTLISAQSCSALASSTLYANYTAFGLRCAATNASSGLQWIAWRPDLCPAVVQQSINASTAAFCASVINNTLVCHQLANSTVPGGVITIERSSLLDSVFKVDGCTPAAPTTHAITLLPNPVGPDAITAIVVLVTLAVIAIMAAFFFWPKCHISADSAQLVPKMKKPNKAPGMVAMETEADGEMNAGFGTDGGAAGMGGAAGRR